MSISGMFLLMIIRLVWDEVITHQLERGEDKGEAEKCNHLYDGQ